jgi:pyrroloquinoline quinone (PQQ) biosynthesis protein C
MDELLAIRARVDAELRATPLVRRMLQGEFDVDLYKRYLINARYYAQFSGVVLALGGARCVAPPPALATYLLRHAGEEQGHDAWALADLADLGMPEAEVLAAKPVSACAALVGYVHYVAGHANPVGLFGWMYILEAVGSDLGTIAGQHLAHALQGLRAVRFVAGHGVADSDHAKELADQIATHVMRPGDRADVVDVAGVVADLYLRMFHEIGGDQARWV